MLMKKQDIIDAYGHFYLVCEETLDSQDCDKIGPSQSRLSPVSLRGGRNYSSEDSWENDIKNGRENLLPISFKIVEFMGRRKASYNDKQLYYSNLLNGIERSSARNTFSTLERAEEFVNEARDRLSKLAKRLKVPALKKPTGYDMLADEIEFPQIIKDETPLYGFDRSANFFTPQVYECLASSPELNICDNGVYELGFKMWWPSQRSADSFTLMDVVFVREQERPDGWIIQSIIDNNKPKDVVLKMTADMARKALKTYAERVQSTLSSILNAAAENIPVVQGDLVWRKSAAPEPSGPA